jgi:hypothetical protein
LLGGSVAAAWSFDGAWHTSLAAIPVRHDDPGVATGSDGRLYVMGGRSGANPTSAVDIYDPALDKWTTSAHPMPTARSTFGAVAIGPRIYSIGGYVQGPQFSYASPTVEAFDVGTQTWSTRAPMPQPLAAFGAAAGPDGRVYVVGGSTTLQNNLPTAQVLAYEPVFDRWTVLPPLADARTGVAAAVGPDGRIYVVGDGLTAASPVEVYGPVASINPSHASPGTTALVTGSNFAANATIKVYLGPSSSGTLLKIGTSTPAGALIPPITFAVPSVPSGDKVITVVDDRSRFPITLSLTVD